MENKHVLVTGCSSGIGLSTAKSLLKKGYSVIATARTDKVLRHLTSIGTKSVCLDLNDPASIVACIYEIKALTPSLHALINNAAYAQPGAVQELSIKSMEKQFQTNVFGTIDLTNRCLPLLLHDDPGRLVFLSSILGVVPAPYIGAYCASKYALEAIVSSLRMELDSTRIKVSCIRPGAIETQFRTRAVDELKSNIVIENSRNKERYEKSVSDLESGKVKYNRSSPDEVAELIVRVLQSKNPKRAYYITKPAKLMGKLRRFLPERCVEAIMKKHG